MTILHDQESLFDGHQSKSFQANANYMLSSHSFFSLDMSAMEDQAMPLFAYLQEKVCRCQQYLGTVVCDLTLVALQVPRMLVL